MYTDLSKGALSADFNHNEERERAAERTVAGLTNMMTSRRVMGGATSRRFKSLLAVSLGQAHRRCFASRHNHATSERLLGLQRPFTARELRTAYFEAAKKCHPDSSAASHRRKEDGSLVTADAADQFLLVTEAYEFLQTSHTTKAIDDDDEVISVDEEEEYRTACLEYLGQPAEIVEESKQCPAFRQWLSGRTDAAYYWQCFFTLHGGLAPKLRRDSIKLLGCTAASIPITVQRRRRQR
jgi:hypothetical protein